MNAENTDSPNGKTGGKNLSADLFRQALADAQLTQQASAKILNVGERTVRRWAKQGIPPLQSFYVSHKLDAYKRAKAAEKKEMGE